MTNRIFSARFFKKTSGKSGYRAAAVIAIAGITSLAQIAMGATSTWSGGGGGNVNWSKNTNWVGATVPSSGNDLLFTGNTNLANTNNVSPFTANSIAFNSAAGAFTLSGQVITVGAGGITNNSTSTQTLSFASTGITLGASETWTAVSGDIAVTSRVQLNGNSLFLVGPDNISISGKISGASSIVFASLNVGDLSGDAGNVTLSGNNDFSSSTVSGLGVDLLSGTLTVGSNNALGTGVLSIANLGAGVTLASNTGGIKIGSPVFAATDFSVAPTGTLQLAGKLSLYTVIQSTIKITLTNGNTLVFAGGIDQQGGTASLTLDAGGLGGQFTFSGSTANTYTGLTTVTGSATLLLSSSVVNGAIAGNLQIDAGSTVRLTQSNQIADTSTVTVNGVFELNGNTETIAELDGSSTGFLRLENGGLTVGQGTYSGTINTTGNPPGGDTLTKVSPGTLTLSGSNKYAGGTFLNEGTIIANNNSALGSGTLVINNTGAGVTLGSGSASINLTNNVDVLTNFSTAPAASAVNANLTLSGLVILDTTGGNSVFTITATNGNTLRFIGGIGESGTMSASLVYDGGGSAVNGVFRIGSSSSPSTYTGSTTVTDDATLQLNSTGVNVAVPGALQIDNGSTVILLKSEQIADSAIVTVNGLFNINGNMETITGLEGSGIVRLSSGTMIASQGNFSGSIRDGASPGGVLIKSGPGTLILSGNNTYTGNTTVNGGLLQVDGAIASPGTVVNTNGTLGGIGFIGGNVTNFGAVSPGDSPGTLSIGGNYVQNTAGKLVIQVAGTGAGQHDLLAVNGSADLGGQLQLVRLNNFIAHPGDKVVFLTANGGVSGVFSNVDTGTILGATVIYEPEEALLEFTGASSFAGIGGLTLNELAVATNLDRVLNDPRASALINFLDNEPLANLRGDYDLIAPEELTAIFDISFSYADVQVSNIEARLAEIRDRDTAPEVTVANVAFQDGKSIAGLSKDDGKKSLAAPETAGSKWDLFMEGSGDFVRVNSDLNASGYNFNTGGVTVGGDYRVCDHFTAGIMAGYANTGATLTQNGAVDVNSGKVGLYSTLFGNGFYLNTMAAGGYNSYDTHRIGLSGIAQGNTDGEEFDGLLGTGYELHQGNFTMGPIASAQYTYVAINGYNENGSLAPLRIASQSQESLRTKAGFKISSAWNVRGVVITPALTAAWQHEFLDSTYALDSSFANGAGGLFTVHGPALGRDAVALNAGVNVQWTPRLGTYIYYDGELGRKNYQLNAVSAGVRVNF